jgi:hypothetical protein
MKSIVVTLGVLVTAIAVGLTSGDSTDPRLQAGFGMPVSLASLDAVGQHEPAAEIDAEVPRQPEPQPTLAKPKPPSVKSGGSSGNIVVEHVPQYSYASCGSTGTPAVVSYGSSGYTQSAYCPTTVTYTRSTVCNQPTTLVARRTPIRTVVRGTVRGTARVVAGTARVATGTTARIVTAPARVASNYRARWTHPSTIQDHMAHDHGISTAGKTQAQLLAEHDAIHDQIGPVYHTSLPSRPAPVTYTAVQPALVAPIVSVPVVSRQIAPAPRFPTVNNCPGGVCPLPRRDCR